MGTTCGCKTISEFLHSLKAITDKLAIIGATLSDDDILIYCLCGLGPQCKGAIAAIWLQGSALCFEDLHDKLREHEEFLKHPKLSPIMANATTETSSQCSNTKPVPNYPKGNKKPNHNQLQCSFSTLNMLPPDPQNVFKCKQGNVAKTLSSVDLWQTGTWCVTMLLKFSPKLSCTNGSSY